VELRFAELLLPDGTVDQTNLRAARARDVYTLRGDPGGENYEPHFTYHGFRYVQVDGYPGIPRAEDLQGIVIFSDLPLTGQLAIDNPLLQRLWKNTLWSQRSNFVGIPTDCPQRDERLGWMGDANVFWDAAAYNMDVAAFTRRFMQDVRDAQSADGAFADYAPAAERLVLFEHGAAPGWADGGVTLPWTAWQRYGDTGIIDENWDAMQRYIRFIHSRNPDYLWRHGRANDYGDWLALDAKQPGDPTTPKELIGTATWAHSVSCLIDMAIASGRVDDASRYRAMRDELERSFAATFVRGDGTIGNGSQTGYILALRYQLVPMAVRAAAAKHLVADIQKRGNLLSTGFLGTPSSLDVLCDAGYTQLAYDLLLRTQFPGWGYMIAKGATTIWERWNGDVGDVSMNSFNHYALGAICGFMFRRIAGIDSTQPGFRAFRFRPMLDARVTRGGARYESVMGRIATNWRRNGDHFSLELAVPPNVSAEVHLPAALGAFISEGGRDFRARKDLQLLRREDDATVLLVGSGEYRFSVG
jgi:alpha-L-rhamnosidase